MSASITPPVFFFSFFSQRSNQSYKKASLNLEANLNEEASKLKIQDRLEKLNIKMISVEIQHKH